MVFSFTYPTPRLISTPSRKSRANEDIMRFAGEGARDRQPYSEREIEGGFMRADSTGGDGA
jgi:ubiquinone biosynthesis protein COQ9